MDQNQQFEDALRYYAARKEEGQEMLLALLRETQEIFGYLSPSAQQRIADAMDIRQSVINAYIRRLPNLKTEASRHEIILCTGPRCSAKRSGRILQELERLLGIHAGETTKDGRYSLTTKNCLKRCGTAPNLRIDQDDYPQADLQNLSDILQRYH